MNRFRCAALFGDFVIVNLLPSVAYQRTNI